jgi:hypothetical protein
MLKHRRLHFRIHHDTCSIGNYNVGMGLAPEAGKTEDGGARQGNQPRTQLIGPRQRFAITATALAARGRRGDVLAFALTFFFAFTLASERPTGVLNSDT